MLATTLLALPVFPFGEADQADELEKENDNFAVYTTVIDILADNIEKFSKILNIIRKTDNVIFLNELNESAFTLILPNDEYIQDDADIDLKSFDIEKYILFDETIDFRENITAGKNTLVVRWGDYPLIFETLNDKVFFYQQRNILDSQKHITKQKHNTYSEILHLGDPLIEKPSEQNCQIYETTSLLPFSKVTLNSFFEIYNDKYYQLNMLSHLLNFYKADYQFMRNFINNTFLAITDDVLKRNFNQIELNYIFNTNPELVTFDMNFDNKAKADLIADQKFVLSELLIHGLLGNGVREPGKIESLNGKTSFELVYGIEDDGYGIFINEFKAESLPNIIQYKDFEDLDYKNGERFGLSYIFNEYEVNYQNMEYDLQKYLMGLNAYDFLQEMYFRDLSYLLKDSKERTLFIYADENFSTSTDSPISGVNGYEGYNKKNLIYHFIEKKISIEDEFKFLKELQFYESGNEGTHQTILFDSMFCKTNKMMGKHCQKLKLFKTEENRFFINDLSLFEIKNPLNPIIINNCAIYLLPEPLELPGSIIQSMGHEFIHSSQSLVFLQNLNLLNLPVNDKGYTIFIPDDTAWSLLDLNLEYLKKNINILNKVWKNYIWEGLLYTDNFQHANYTNLNGDIVNIEEFKNSSVVPENVHIISKHQNFSIKRGNDIIFERGVLHPISQIEYPIDIQITIKNLLETTNNGIDFMIFLKELPELISIINQNLPYSFIVPTSSAMLKDDQFNVNATDFENLMKLHVVQINSTELLKNCDNSDQPLSTFLDDVSIFCKKVDVGGRTPSLFLILKNKQGDEKKIRVLQKGCQTNNPDSCIYIVDEPMSLKWVNNSPILELHLNLSWQSFLMGLLVGGFSLLAAQVIGFGIKKYKQELAEVDYDEFDDNDPDDLTQRSRRVISPKTSITQRSLLFNEINHVGDACYGSVSEPSMSNIVNNNKATNFEAGYSENSQSRPITVQKQKSQLFDTNY